MRYLIIFIIVFCNQVYCQKISGNLDLPAPQVKFEQIDYSSYQIIYSYEFVRNKDKPSSITQSLTMLEVGDNYAKFYDYHQQKYDSVNLEMSKKSRINTNDINVMLSYRKDVKFKGNIFKDLQNNSIDFHKNIYGKSFLYQEQIPTFNWRLQTNETKDILGYVCKKATLEYGGRKWTVWYAEQIPINFGPYIFQGLPGLIMEMHDNQKHHVFTMQSIVNKTKPMLLFTEEIPIKTTKKEFYKAERNYHENPEIYHGQSFSSPGVAESTSLKSIPYNPIELE